MNDLICINDLFSTDALKIYEKYGVITPERDKIYSVRDVIINSSGQTGLLLEELINPKIPDVHSIIGVVDMEPNWKISRFRNLDQTNVDALAISRELKHSLIH